MCLIILVVFLVSCQGFVEDIKEADKAATERVLGERDVKVRDPAPTEENLHSQDSCSIPLTQRQFSSEPYYTGPLIDSHVHMPVASKIVSTVAIRSGFEDMPAYDDQLSIEYLACLFESEGIKKVFGFNVAPNMVVGQSVKKVKSNQEKYSDMFVHFYQPTQLPGLNPAPDKVDSILSENPGLFQGYGEVKFSFEEIENYGIRDAEYLAAYELADQHNLIVMMHPGQEHKRDVVFLLEKHPHTTFLFHGGESNDWIFDVLQSYENAFYTFEPNIYIFGWAQEHEFTTPSKQEFLAYMDQNFQLKLEEQLGFWKSRIEQHPNKFLWGTDRWFRWHFDVEVGANLEEFGRSFIGQLHPDVQEKFAYKNAEMILKN
jgi:hypothetical protein